MAKKRSPYLSRAQLAAVVRFSPQEAAVAALLRQAQTNYRVNLNTAHALAGGVGLIDRARPQIDQIYTDAGLQAGPAPAPQLPSGSLDFKSAAAFEQGAAQHRLGEARAAELTNLADQRLAAHSAGVYGTANARKQLQSDVTDVLGRQSSLAREKGAFVASTMMDLADAAASRGVTIGNSKRSARQSERNSIRSSGIDPATGKPIPGGKLDPKAKSKQAKWLTPEQNSRVVDAVNEAATWITRLQSSQHLSSREIRQHLIAGDTLTDAKQNKIKLPKIPKALVNAAYDIVALGGLSQPNVDELHRRRVKIKGNLPVLAHGPLTAQQKKTYKGIFGLGA